MKAFTTHQIANGKSQGRLPHFDEKWLTNGHFFIGAKEPVAAAILNKSSANFPLPPDWSDMCSGWIMGGVGEELTAEPTENEKFVFLGGKAYISGYVMFFAKRGYRFMGAEPISGQHGVKLINKSGEAVGILLGCKF